MFFCILFSYTILRDTKDVLVRASARQAPALHRPCDPETKPCQFSIPVELLILRTCRGHIIRKPLYS